MAAPFTETVEATKLDINRRLVKEAWEKHYPAINKDPVLSFGAKLLDLQVITQWEINKDTKEKKRNIVIYLWNISY